MVKRGPDGAGLWLSQDGKAGLAHRRLAIIDLSDAGAQPMATADGRLVVTFNGEIYNYRELRKDLEGKGFRFRSNCDTEVLLHLYADRGVEMVHALRGMYAFAIWDERKRGLLLARDPMGIKPLYYSDSGSSIRFASQVKALVAGNGIDATPAPAGHMGFYLWGHVPEPFTTYAHIRALPAGCTLWTNRGGPRKPAQYFDVAEVLREGEQNPVQLAPGELRERVRELLLDTVRHHLIADVPVGIFLSSGMDSTVLTALTTEFGVRPRTVTLGFNEFKGTREDEVPLAELVARQYGSAHHSVWVSRRDFADELEDLLRAMDQPTIDGVNCYFVSKAAASLGLKVAISGLGGDELFRGYPSFQQIPRLVRALSPLTRIPGVGRISRRISAPFFRHTTSPKYAGLLEYGGSYGGAYLLRRGLFMRWEFSRQFGMDFSRQGWAELRPVLKMNQYIAGLQRENTKISALELGWYMRNQLLRDADWAGMAHSLEIRVPFVDSHLLKSLAPLLASAQPPGKAHIAQSPADPLPRAVRERGKTGFCIPVRQWLFDQGEAYISERGLRGWSRRVGAAWPLPSVGALAARRETVLVSCTGQLAHAFAALPALQAIRRRHPHDHLVLLTDRRPSEGEVSPWDLFECTDWFDETVFYAAEDSSWAPSSAPGSTIAGLREIWPEVAYNLTPAQNLWQRYRDWLFFRQFIGVEQLHNLRVDVFTPPLVAGRLAEATIEWRHLLAAIPGEETCAGLSSAAIRREDLDYADKLLREAGGDDLMQFFAFKPIPRPHTGALDEETSRALACRLLQTSDRMQILVLGAAKDGEIGYRLRAEFGRRVHNFAGKLSANVSAAVLRRCCGYVYQRSGC